VDNCVSRPKDGQSYPINPTSPGERQFWLNKPRCPINLIAQ
jgi:hypothetical protein